MKNFIQISGIIAVVLFSASCKTSSVHNSQNSLDWAGTYRGVFPGTDGKNIVSTLELNNDLTYRMQSALMDEPDQITTTQGSFKWSRDGRNITLKDSRTMDKTIYQVGENRLIKQSGNTGKVTDASQFVLEKVKPDEITEKYWKLIEIEGQPVVVDDRMRSEPYIILKKENNRLVGTSGCNSFNGTYELEGMNRIHFSKIAATMMACINMDIEQKMLKVFEMADNYTLSPDGKNLSLNRARMAPLARFEVVYLR